MSDKIDVDKLVELRQIEEKKTREALAENLLLRTKIYKMGIIFGLSVGTLFCVTGFILIILGLTGSIELIFEATNLKSKLSNASPGALFAFMGMIIIWRFKPDIKDELLIKPVGDALSSMANETIFRGHS